MTAEMRQLFAHPLLPAPTDIPAPAAAPRGQVRSAEGRGQPPLTDELNWVVMNPDMSGLVGISPAL